LIYGNEKKMKNIKKRAVFFSLDSLIALAIIVFTVLLVYPYISSSSHHSEVQEDFAQVFSTLKIGEVNDSYVASLIAQGDIYDLNQSVLEQIGEFYITNKTLAKQLASAMFSYLDTSENIGIWYGGNLVASKNSTPYESAKNIEVVTHRVSGLSNIEQNGSITGYSARAWLANGMAQKYFYFGGYAGDGNISVIINYSGDLTNVDIEMAVNKDFDLFINGNPSGHYENSSSEFAPSKYDLSAYNSSFNDGENTLELVADGLYIAGGYIRIVYDSSEGYSQPTRYYFPGIEGLINIYDGFYVPGQLNALNILLHMNSSYEMFFTVGNITVYEGNTSGEEVITISNSELDSELDYSEISQKTTPIRLGLKNATYVSKRPADSFSVTDISGSMCGDCSGTSCSIGSCCGIGCWKCDNDEPKCNSCGGSCQSMIGNARQANKEFVDIVLNYSGNRVGLVAYESNVDLADWHNLSNNSASLKSKIDSWRAVGGTCICCGINTAADTLNASSYGGRFKSIVIMSDGEANVQCARQGTGNAKNDAILAACQAFNNSNIKVYAIGFGPSSDNATLQAIAACGNGSYYFANTTNLIEVYKRVASDVLEASYSEQTIEAGSGVYTQLYPDSYIEFNYTKSPTPYGLITTLESQFYDSYYGNFSISPDSEIVESQAVSYSGPRWTDRVEINSLGVYNLSFYGSDYTQLGDPYPIRIPNSLVQDGNNAVKVTTGVSPMNTTEGSPYKKIIYTTRQNASSYSEIVALADGCNWELEFETGPDADIKVPGSYTGADNCYYKSSGQNISNDKDAFQLATFSLLQLLDSDKDGRVDVKFTEQNLEISASEITGVPYIISTDVQIRRWD